MRPDPPDPPLGRDTITGIARTLNDQARDRDGFGSPEQAVAAADKVAEWYTPPPPPELLDEARANGHPLGLKVEAIRYLGDDGRHRWSIVVHTARGNVRVDVEPASPGAAAVRAWREAFEEMGLL